MSRMMTSGLLNAARKGFLLLAAVGALIVSGLPQMAIADSSGPFAALFIGTSSSDLRLAGSIETITTCGSATRTLGVYAEDPDGLGFPIFAGFGNNTPVVVVWSFGGATPSSSLDYFNVTPRVRFPARTRTRVSATVYDRNGDATTVSFRVDTVCLQ